MLHSICLYLFNLKTKLFNHQYVKYLTNGDKITILKINSSNFKVTKY